MSANADILLLTYSIVLVGITTGAQMLYYGAVLHRPMRLGGDPIAPDRLRTGGAIFVIAGVLAVAVMLVEILSGAGGTNLLPFGIDTIAVPFVVVWYNARRSSDTGER